MTPSAQVPDQPSGLPPLEVLVEAAWTGRHPWIASRVPAEVSRAALAEELGFWLDTAAQDMTYAERFAAHAPDVGQPVAAYLDRWLPLTTGGHVLAGPRYLGLDPDLPFVGVSASDRVLRVRDANALREAAQAFRAFNPGFVMLSTTDPAGAWPGTRTEMRWVVGLLGDLRRRDVPEGVAAVPRSDVGDYERYEALYAGQVAREPSRRRWARAESRDDLEALATQGLLFDVLVDGTWAGVLAAEPDVRWGARGATVVELLLDHPYRGRGLGRHLSSLLARAVPMPDEDMLFGTIHSDNLAAYRSALAAGRADVGGEVVISI